MPVLNWDGEEVGQSVTIARFCARKLGLAGKDDVEQAKADAIVDHVVDCFVGKYFKSSVDVQIDLKIYHCRYDWRGVRVRVDLSAA